MSAALPHWRELTRVFRTPLRRHDSELLKRARMLASLHRVREFYPDRAAVLEASRTALRRQLAAWIIEYTGAGPGAAAICATVIDDMAAAHVTAERMLQVNPPPSDEQLHAAWSDVGYLATRWADLVAEVIDGQPPVPWPPSDRRPPGTTR
ncbi:hypothetical protein AB0H71_13235 [Nocardia sp. NPDC050697]|uniref:hypothetical protein n=1 Tax=Nocardia sp. NPDC050697 TaxID=3155158 RepID=UPI0033F94A8D